MLSAIRCGAPTAPTNGRVVGYSYNYEDNVTVECGPGFYLEGSHLLSCTRDGIWVGNMDDSPICVGKLLVAITEPSFFQSVVDMKILLLQTGISFTKREKILFFPQGFG